MHSGIAGEGDGLRAAHVKGRGGVRRGFTNNALSGGPDVRAGPGEGSSAARGSSTRGFAAPQETSGRTVEPEKGGRDGEDPPWGAQIVLFPSGQGEIARV